MSTSRFNKGVNRRRPSRRRGAALVTVLWLTTALAVIGVALAHAVREDTKRTENLVEGTRAALLAAAGIERTMFFFDFPPLALPGVPVPYTPGQPRMIYRFPGGEVTVDILSESGKLDINSARPEQLLSLFLAAGIAPDRAQALAAAIVEWRRPAADSSFLMPASTFWVRHSSFEQIEELLLVPGLAPELYYGFREPLPGGGVAVRPGLRELLSVRGSANAFDINSAHPAVLALTGLSPAEIQWIVDRRRQQPFEAADLTGLMLSTGPATQTLRAGFDGAYLIRSTARPARPDGQLSDYRRTTAAYVVFETLAGNRQRPVIRQWYDLASWTGEAPRP
jgi:general secretion pathway protein K